LIYINRHISSRLGWTVEQIGRDFQADQAYSARFRRSGGHKQNMSLDASLMNAALSKAPPAAGAP
jgi:hypothetical protein